MFSLIGLSETKIKVNQDPLLNTEILGYVFELQLTLSNTGELASIFVMIYPPLIQTFNP